MYKILAYYNHSAALNWVLIGYQTSYSNKILAELNFFDQHSQVLNFMLLFSILTDSSRCIHTI